MIVIDKERFEKLIRDYFHDDETLDIVLNDKIDEMWEELRTEA